MPGRPLQRSHAIRIAAARVLLTAYNIVRVVRTPPWFDARSPGDVVLEDVNGTCGDDACRNRVPEDSLVDA